MKKIIVKAKAAVVITSFSVNRRTSGKIGTNRLITYIIKYPSHQIMATSNTNKRNCVIELQPPPHFSSFICERIILLVFDFCSDIFMKNAIVVGRKKSGQNKISFSI